MACFSFSEVHLKGFLGEKRVIVSRDELGVNVAGNKLRVRSKVHQEVHVGGQTWGCHTYSVLVLAKFNQLTCNVELCKASAQLEEGREAVWSPNDQLGDHRIVVHGDLVTHRV